MNAQSTPDRNPAAMSTKPKIEEELVINNTIPIGIKLTKLKKSTFILLLRDIATSSSMLIVSDS